MFGLRRAARWLLQGVTMVAAIGALCASAASAAGTLTVEPSTVDFGTREFGQSDDRSVVVANAGPDAVVISEVALIGDVDPFDFVGGSCEEGLYVAPGGTCDLALRFSPVGPAAAAHGADLVVAGGAADEPAIAALTAQTSAVVPLSATPQSLKFRTTIASGRASTQQPVFVRNLTGTALEAPSITGDFRVTSNTCSTSASQQGFCAVAVAFQPPVGTTGTQTGALTLRAGGETLTISLTGIIDRGRPPLITILSPPGYGTLDRDLAALTDAVPQLIRGGPSRLRQLPQLTTPVGGRLALTLFGWNRARRVRIGGGVLMFERSGSGQLGFRLDKKGRALLRRPQRTRIKVVLTFEVGGRVVLRQGPELFVKRPLKKKPNRR